MAEWMLFFCIYSFLGWCAEVVFEALKSHTFVNRGFLNGPVCPIYGFGACAVIAMLTPLRGNALVLFLGAMLITSAIEFIVGFLLERIFNEKWWDYSDIPLNIKGYVCLRFSLMWGAACLPVMYLIHPLIAALVGIIPDFVAYILIALLAAAFITDTVLTVCGILRFKRSVALLTAVGDVLKRTSDFVGENLTDAVFNAEEKSGPNIEKGRRFINDMKEKQLAFRQRAEAHGEELFSGIKEKYSSVLEKNNIHTIDELREKYRKLLDRKNNRAIIRLSDAFPRLKKQNLFASSEKKLDNIKRRIGK